MLTGCLILVSSCTASGEKARGPATASADARRDGGTLRIAIVRPDGLDPARARTAEELFLADQLFDTVIALDPVTLEPVAGLASRWEASPDQQRWDLTVAEGRTFSDGTPVTAGDIKFTLERIAAKGSGSTVADLLEPIRGFRAVNVDGTTADLAGVTVDGGRISIQLDQPWAVLPAVLANPAFGIVPEADVEARGAAWSAQPVGSGPFRLARVEADRLELVAQPSARAHLDGIEVELHRDRSSAYASFTEQGLDWAPVPPEKAEAAAARFGTDGFRPYGAELFYGFNLRNPNFADIRMREAVARAVDRASIADAVYGGTVEPIEGVIVPGFPGSQPSACPRCAHDPAAARALVAQVHPDGDVPEIAIDFDDDPTQQSVARVIKANLEAVGIPVALRPRPLGEYQSVAVSGDQQLFRLGWVPPYASPDAYLAPLFVTGSPSNLTGLSSAAVDEAVRAVRAEPDRAARLARAQEAERLVMAEVPVVPIAQFRLLTVVSTRVRDLELSMMGSFDATKVWLAEG